MLIYFLSIATVNFNYFIDGLSNVELHANATNQDVNIIINKKDIFFFYQKTNNVKFTVLNNNTEIKNVENGFHIQENSIIKISSNWDELLQNYNDSYILGFYDGSDCDLIFYSNLVNEYFPLDFYPNKKKCVYHFYKNSTISDSEAQVKNWKSFSNFYKSNPFKKQGIKGIIKVTHDRAKLLEDVVDDFEEDDYEFKIEDNDYSLIFGIVINILGIIFYIIWAYSFGTEFGGCNFIRKHGNKIQNFENKFFSVTLKEDYHQTNG